MGWLGIIRPVCDAVIEVLWLIRESAQPIDKIAVGGMYQHRMQKDASCRLLRVSLPDNSSCIPKSVAVSTASRCASSSGRRLPAVQCKPGATSNSESASANKRNRG